MRHIKYIIAVCIGLLVLGLLGGYEATYTREATISKVENGIVYAVDNCGYEWTYYGNATIGESVTLVMDDAHTSTIKDDIVKGVR